MLKALLRGKKEMDVEPKTAGKIRMMIRQGLLLKSKIEMAKAKLEEINEKLLPYAEELRGTTQLSFSTYRSEDGEVTVKFADMISWDDKDMPQIKKILGPLFATVIDEIPTFAVNPRDIQEIKDKLGKDFDRLIAEQSLFKQRATLKDLIADADNPVGMKLRNYIRIEAKKPGFTYQEAVKEAAVKVKVEGDRKKVA